MSSADAVLCADCAAFCLSDDLRLCSRRTRQRFLAAVLCADCAAFCLSDDGYIPSLFGENPRRAEAEQQAAEKWNRRVKGEGEA